MRRTGRLLVLLLVMAATIATAAVATLTPSFSATVTSIFLPQISRGFNNSNWEYSPSNTVSPYGVQIDWLGNATAAAKAKEMGAGWVRAGISWNEIEPVNTTPDNFIWTTYDNAFAGLAQAGVQPLVAIATNPSWAAPTTCGPINADSLQEFASFAQALAARYSQAPYNVHYWEIYNEPDNTDSVNRAWLGGCWGGHGTDYANMLKAVYPAMKAADPQAQILLGSLAYDYFTTTCDENGAHCGIFDKNFLDDVVSPSKGNAGAYFDIMAFHSYTVFRNVWEQYGADLIGKTNYLKNKLASYGLTKPMAITEMAQWSAKPGDTSTDEDQMRYVTQGFVRALAADIKLTIWFNMQDTVSEAIKYGLVNPDLTAKPAFTTYQKLTTLLSGTVYSGTLQIGGVAPSNVEGYTFTLPSGMTRHVLWATADGTVKVDFPGKSGSIRDKNGTLTTQADAADGASDGKVSVSVTKSPIYVDIAPYDNIP